MGNFELKACGQNAVLVQLGDGNPAAVANFMRASLSGLSEAIPAHDTVLLQFKGVKPLESEIHSLLGEAIGLPEAQHEVRLIEVPVRYDGDDLRAVADSLGISEEEVVRLHSEPEYRAEFCGFAPGFAYLTGLPDALQLPRREVPRARVPRGSVAIAGEYSGVYPAASPGGWHLLGSTSINLFDPENDSPALIQPGDRVRFTP